MIFYFSSTFKSFAKSIGRVNDMRYYELRSGGIVKEQSLGIDGFGGESLFLIFLLGIEELDVIGKRD